ncbi:conserved hypothetical protein [Candidatus Desulfosporosinus infrequens]|uniref:Uncharacterized protein n=1 Tax=Candidatus Desulfosporosinus infrequens TaxID=2043169 RepID=A0A2U3KCX9_9FIRM|nr:conserved hypothetical protein [Candidatus Desulfosporosinus infrequens]
MLLKTIFPKIISYLASIDPYSTPYSYYIPYPTEESEIQTNANNDPNL